MTVSCHYIVMDGSLYTIDDLCEKTGFTRRNIRYYVEIGLIEPPAGRGRGGFYNDSHLSTLQDIKRLQVRGLRLSAIIEQLKEGPAPEIRYSLADRSISPSKEVWVQYEITPGIVLSVRSDIEDRHTKDISEIVRLATNVMHDGGKK